MPSSQRDRVFVSYSHKDREWLDKFAAVLAPDIRNARVDYWDDRELQPGDPWHAKIVDAIVTARVAVLLVSPNFLASRFIMEEELPRILAARDDGLTIIWVPLLGAFYGPDAPPQLKPITEMQAAFDAGKPLAEQDPASQATLLLNLCHQIQRILNPTRVASNLPFNSLGELFKGRDEALAQLDRSLREHGSAAIVQPQAIHGLGGIGKTRLAIEYAWRHQNDFSAFLFVSANTPDDLDRNLAALSRPDCLDLRESQSPNQEEQRDAVIRWLQTSKEWLLILDNVDTDEGVAAVKVLVAKLRGGHLLITSRVTQWGRSVQRFALDVLPLEDAVAFLLESAGSWRASCPDDPAQAGILAERLGCLPLALTHATAYMERHNRGFAAYLEDFAQHFERLLAYHDHLTIEYETQVDEEAKTPSTAEAKADRKKLVKTVATTFFLSFDRLTSEAKSILQSAAFLAPEPIPVAMYEQCPEEVAALVTLWTEETAEPKTSQTVPDAIADLARYSLISRGEEIFRVHRMVQLVLRSHVPKDHVPNWIEAARAVLWKYAPDETAEDPKTWPVWDLLVPHGEVLVAFAKTDERIQPHIRLLHALGQLYFGKARYQASLEITHFELKTTETRHGTQSREVASLLIDYGEALRVLDRKKEAEKAFRDSLAISEALDGPNSHEVAVALHYLAMTVERTTGTQEAESLYRRALAIYEMQNDRADKLAFVKTLNNLGAILAGKGDLSAAESLLQKALSLAEQHLGSDHFMTLFAMATFAEVLERKDALAEAEPLMRRALDGMEKFYGPDHPNIARVLNSLASLLLRTQRWLEAEPLSRRALAITERTFGPNRAEVGFRLTHLASILHFLNREPEAGACLRRALAIFEKTLSPGDPNLLNTISNLASHLDQIGHFEEAVSFHQLVLEAQERALGPEHPDLLASQANQCHTWRKQDHASRAEPVDRKVAATTAKILGESHPLTIHRRDNLVLTLIMLGNLDEARQILIANWRVNAPPHANTTPRIPFLRHSLALLQSQSDGPYLGLLKTLLVGPELPKADRIGIPWDIAYFLEFLKPKLGEHHAEFLISLVAAMNDRAKLSDLDRFPEWRNQPPISLDTSWPDV